MTSEDNSVDNFPVLQRLILSALQAHHKLSDIALAVDREKPNTHKALKKLIKRGLVERAGSHYILSGSGVMLIQRRELSGVESPIEGITYQLTDHHDISFNVLLWNIPEGWDKWLNICCGLHLEETHPSYPHDLAHAARKWGVNRDMHGWDPVDITLFNGFSFRCHPRGVLVHIPSIVSDSPTLAARVAFKRLVSILPKLERWLKLEPTALYKQGRLNIQLKSSHFALFDNEFSKWWVNVEGHGREQFAVKGDDGNLLLYMDRSPAWSLETADPVKGELAAGWVQDYFKPIAEGRALRPDEVKVRVEAAEAAAARVSELLACELTPTLREFTLQMAAHVGTAKANVEAARALRDTVMALNVLLAPVLAVVVMVRRVSSWWSRIKGYPLKTNRRDGQGEQ